MSQFDIIYAELVKRIDREGVWSNGKDVRARWRDGMPAHTKSIFFHTMTFSPDEIPILTTKFNSPDTANKERHWIWNMKSNDINDLLKIGVRIWNEWRIEGGRWNGTIGPAYGFQLAKKVINIKGKIMDQVDYILHELTNNPTSRRIMTELWNVDDLNEMSLAPCVHHTQWDTFDGTLNLLVKARSSDVGLGLPFNIYQYAVLHRLVAIHTGLPLGKMHFVLGNAHIYDRHMDVLREQITREPLPAPELFIDPNIKNFYDFQPEHIKVLNYEHHGKLAMEIAE
ncbi:MULTISPECIES: thymidylate synthase [Bacillus subtilis group]|uniref:thymidylate synthase n=1 Tax=Bacillus subtilis group TaxID=653685 RepID=UPI000B3ECE74|nr:MULTISPECIES: thymidylate synthase [Bacillus subtilis group]ARW41726.1 Thymidylate synthase [Bacillus licheniformis]MEC0474998.1 thymidylate synthase [Bacillus licheniformis]PRS16412.1 thymidylate synthase [Bacillus paralicheniformis]